MKIENKDQVWAWYNEKEKSQVKAETCMDCNKHFDYNEIWIFSKQFSYNREETAHIDIQVWHVKPI